MLDSFPLDVTIDGTLHRVCRLVTHDGRALVFRSRDGLPELIAEATLVEAPDPRRAFVQLHTDAGVWGIARSGHCGCRDVLRRLSQERLLQLIGVS